MAKPKILIDKLLEINSQKDWIMTRRAMGSSLKEEDRWFSYKFQEVHRASAQLAAWLREERGIKEGDIVGILSENRIESIISLFAIHLIGGIVFPLNAAFSPEIVRQVLTDFQVRFLLVSTPSQNKKNLDQMPSLLFESETFKKICSHHRELSENQRTLLKENSPGFLLTTSGTTGDIKGALLSHYGIYRGGERIKEWGDHQEWDKGIFILPLCHVAGLTEFATSLMTGSQLFMVETKEEIAKAMPTAQPTYIACVPNLFENLTKKIMEGVRNGSWTKRKLFSLALRLGRKNYRGTLNGLERLFLPMTRHLVSNRIRKKLGGKILKFYTGAAPLTKATFDFLWSLGFPIFEGYGLTETSGLVSGNSLKAFKFGTVGRPASDTDIRIAEDGEIQIKDRTLVLKYLNAPLPLTMDGYFKSGDLGKFTEDGFLQITGRKKELIILNTGENISPVKVEEALKKSPLIQNAVAFGNGRKFLSAAIIPNNSSQPDQLANEIQSVTSSLAKFEQPKKFFVIKEIPPELLTAVLKLKRHLFEEHFREQIEALYEGPSQ